MHYFFHFTTPTGQNRETIDRVTSEDDYGQRQLVLVDTLTELLYAELTPEFPRASVAVT